MIFIFTYAPVSLISPVEAKIKEQTNAYVSILTADSVYQPQKESTMVFFISF